MLLRGQNATLYSVLTILMLSLFGGLKVWWGCVIMAGAYRHDVT
jgi:hypothetical protein